MELFLFNLKWMIFNCVLAAIPMFLSVIVFKKKFTLLKFTGAIIWFFFLPNTIYLATDIVNLIYDVNYITGFYLFLDTLMYIVLIPIGVVTYIWAVKPFEKMFSNKLPIPVLNFFVGFGVILGRVQRANSWEIASDPQSVIVKSIEIMSSLELMLLVLVFAAFSQVIYSRLGKFVSKA